MDVQTAAKVHTHSIICNELVTDRNQNYSACSNQARRVSYQLSGQFVKCKFNFSHNMCGSVRDETLIVSDRNRTYRELSEGIL